jgi:circadian clock protein KaiC
MTDDNHTPIERNPTGVAGLDEILGGGLFVGGVYLVAGRPGSGKTMLANQVAFAHVTTGGRALYVTLLAESHARMLVLMEPMSFFRPEAVGDSLQYISGYHILETEKLAGLLRMLRSSVRDHRATLLVIDGLLTAHDLIETEIEVKKFIHEVQVFAELAGCTTLLLRGAHDAAETYPERTMADGLLLLTTMRIGMRAVREIEIQKHRGSAHVMGSSFFEISTDGVAVYPRMEARLGLAMAARDDGDAALVTTGIKSLDAVLRGGLPAGSTTMLLGSPGIGKTLLGLQFLDAGARAGASCLYFGFRESPAGLVRKAKSIGVDLAAHEKQGTLALQWHSPREPLADRLVEALLDTVRRRHVNRVFIDGFEGLRAGLIHPERAQAFAFSLDHELRALAVTTLLSETITGVFGPELEIPAGTAEAVDNILFLRQVELRSQIRRLVSVMKMRGQGYDTSLREFEITETGLEVAATFETAEAILTGVARPLPQPTSRGSSRIAATRSRTGRSGRRRG